LNKINFAPILLLFFSSCSDRHELVGGSGGVKSTEGFTVPKAGPFTLNMSKIDDLEGTKDTTTESPPVGSGGLKGTHHLNACP
jgi:hypothetical protein